MNDEPQTPPLPPIDPANPPLQIPEEIAEIPEIIAEPSPEPTAAEQELDQLKNELTDMTTAAKTALADLANYKKRVSEDRRSWGEHAVRELLLALLPTVDSFEKAMHHIQGKVSPSTLSGLDAVYKQFTAFLEKFGVHSFECVGKSFDPMKHEALLSGPGEKDIILEEIEKGYLMGEKILRPAKVKVGNGGNTVDNP